MIALDKSEKRVLEEALNCLEISKERHGLEIFLELIFKSNGNIWKTVLNSIWKEVWGSV